MRFSQRILISAVAVMVVSAGAAMAHSSNGNAINVFDPALQSYSGAWPVTVTHSQRSNGTYCLTLTQNGSKGGSATLVASGQKYFGSFVVVNDILMATLTEPLYGQNGALMFTARASRGHIGQGIYENVEGGSNFDFGALAFGTKGGC